MFDMQRRRNFSASAERLVDRTVSHRLAIGFVRSHALLLFLILFPVLPVPLMQTSEVRAEARTHPTTVAQQPPPELKAGTPIQRNLGGGASHHYRILLATGQYLRVRIEPHDIDVLVTLFTPDGGQLIERDRNEEGPEVVQIIAEHDGDYLLVINVPDKAAAPGNYRVKIEQLRSATPDDRSRTLAESITVAGEQLQAQTTAESLRQALEKYREALPIYQNIGEQSEAAILLDNIGRAYYDLSELEKALDSFNQALPIFRSLKDRQSEASVLNNIAAVYDDMGEKQKALEAYLQVLQIFQSLRLRSSAAILLNNIAFTYQSLGEEEKALDYYLQALPLRQAAGDKAGEANTLHNLGRLYFARGEIQLAVKFFNQALRLYKTVGDHRGEAYSLSNLGVVYRQQGNPQKALDYHHQALEILEASGDLRGKAMTLSSIGAAYVSLANEQKARDYYRQSLMLARSLQDHALTKNILTAIAYLERRSRNDEAARRHIEEAIAIIESLRGKVEGQELRATFLASNKDCYDFYIDLLMQLAAKQPAKEYTSLAFEVSERSRARSLLDLLREAHVDIREGVDPELLGRERILQAQLNHKELQRNQLLSTPHTAAQLDTLESELKTLLTAYQQTEAQIRTHSPRYATMVKQHSVSLKEVQQLLDEDTVLLEYSLGEPRSYLWLVSASSITAYTLPGRGVIESLCRRAYDLLTNSWKRELRVQTKLALDELSRTILAPVAAQLGSKRVLIVADGALEYIPFAALPLVGAGKDNEAAVATTDYRPLILDHEVIHLPSASTLAVLRQVFGGRLPAEKTVAVLADPVLQRDDPRVKPSTNQRMTNRQTVNPSRTRTASDLNLNLGLGRLRFSRHEAETIVGFATPEESLKALDFEASRTRAMSAEMRQYRILHFATHGLINSLHPELSGIVLSLVDEQGKPQDGFLRLHDIYNLRLAADLVVLSACRTVLGKAVKGEGLIGLTRGFMYAGATRVLASLWDVKDDATAELMKRYYYSMLKEGASPAAALRAAQISLLKEPQWQMPYFWAGFILQGDWTAGH
jgi:CHAT domain-containing protein/Flp pilus assembly protein TadD